jgi:Ni,Fe-hydrogenase III large subunit
MMASPGACLTIHNAESFARADLPILPPSEFRDRIVSNTSQGARLAALFGQPIDADAVRIHADLAHQAGGGLSALATDVVESYAALTPECPQAHWFERELAEQWGVRPIGHPWLKPIRFHRSYRAARDGWDRPADAPLAPGVTDFYRVEGEEVHEVAVGPVHAGVIEPGHFRFQCHGEEVLHLEISLGYQHRGIERALRGGPSPRTLHWMETLAGDTTIGHALAYCQAIESLTGAAVPPRADKLRAIALESERMANHAGDLGALAGDIGFLPTASFCGRLRGSILNVTALLCGNRFGRSLLRPGGIRFDADEARLAGLTTRLDELMRDLERAVELLWRTASVMARFEGTGRLTREQCIQAGLVGPAARACGIERDVRADFPTGFYRYASIPPATWHSGDVFARAIVRWLEIQRSAAFIREQVRTLPDGPIANGVTASLAPDRIVISLIEGWRGEICHVALTDAAGRFAAYKVIDPSFHNWFGLALAMRNQPISDFPLCNKSFNLSYCGHDL